MTPAVAWTMLVLSGAVDVAWAYSTKKSDGFSNLGWGALSLVLLAIFITLLSKSLQVLPLGTAYAAWTGIGAIGAFLVGVLAFGEGLQASRILFAGLIVLGVIGLKVTS